MVARAVPFFITIRFYKDLKTYTKSSRNKVVQTANIYERLQIVFTFRNNVTSLRTNQKSALDHSNPKRKIQFHVAFKRGRCIKLS